MVLFNVDFELSRSKVLDRIDKQIQKGTADYICVADGNVLQRVHTNMDFRKVINGGMLSICDSSWALLFGKWIYGISVKPYCGSDIFEEIISKKKYSMLFLGSSDRILNHLKERLVRLYDPKIVDMQFVELPFRDVGEFDYSMIAEIVNKDNPDIIWISLGSPKQEIFMSRLKPHLDRGVMIAVGAVFEFYSCAGEKRAPLWMRKCRLEYLYRIIKNPRKQLSRCVCFLKVLPLILTEELKKRAKKS